MTWKMSLERLPKISLWLAIGLLLLAGCPQAAKWRDAQIAQSKTIAKGDAVDIPQQPITVPAKVAAELPLHGSFIITQYSASAKADSVTVCALSQWDTEQTAVWMLSELARLEYQADQNPSELLNGIECYNPDRRYARLKATVTMNNSGQCLLRLEAAEE